ncbi:MAG: cytochrome c1 [Lysobacterales bacterium]|jgi:ubiquinol-cytochrome c reductase cytochrome c1 subunit|nr:MAG: cytochrome c1 [Xanthomonadales bacterium]
MRTKLLALAAVLAPVAAFAAGGEAKLDHANVDVTNRASLQRGAANFVNYCLGCHSAKFVRYNRMAADLGLSEEQLIANLMYTGERPHDTMRIGMVADDAKRWFGVLPPDLSLVARSRGADYLYTFLRSFYVDPSKPTGVNNIVLPGTAMPHVLWELQGVQEAVWEGHPDAQGNVQKHFKEFKLLEPGRMTPEEFDGFVRDTVNFLEYAAEPAQLQRKALGFPVIAFLVFFTLLAWALKKEYWKDVK